MGATCLFILYFRQNSLSLSSQKMLSNNQLPDLADHIQGASRTDQSLGPGPFLRLIQTFTNRIGCFHSFHIFAYFPGTLLPLQPWGNWDAPLPPGQWAEIESGPSPHDFCQPARQTGTRPHDLENTSSRVCRKVRMPSGLCAPSRSMMGFPGITSNRPGCRLSHSFTNCLRLQTGIRPPQKLAGSDRPAPHCMPDGVPQHSQGTQPRRRLVRR